MNWKRLYLNNTELVGHNILVKAGENGTSYFCGQLRQRANKTYFVCGSGGSYHYFRSNIEYYYVNIDEIK